MKRKLKDYLKISLFGFSMGAANVIPGVSGGTMAFILGIYEELISSIREFASVKPFKYLITGKFRKLYNEMPWPFLLALGIGVLIALVSLAKFLTFSLDKYPSLTYGLFFGLVIASILSVLKMVKKWRISRFTAMFIGALFAFWVVTRLPTDTPNEWWNLFLCGVIIICAMILPGISGSFLLLIMGQYKYVLGAVNLLISVPLALIRSKPIPETDLIMNALTTLFWITTGCIIGLGTFSHFLTWLFKKYHDLTVATLIGFMVGSLWKIWPWQKITEVKLKYDEVITHLNLSIPEELEKYNDLIAKGAKIKMRITENILPVSYDSFFYFAVILAIAGFAVVIIMEKFAAGKEEKTVESNKN